MSKPLVYCLVLLTLLVAACQGEQSTPQDASPAAAQPLAASATPMPDATASQLPEGSLTESDTNPPPTPAASPAEPATATPAPTPVPTQTAIPAAPAEAISLRPIVEGVFSRPTYLTHAFDQRLFVVEQAGLIHIVQEGTLLPQPFLDIRDRVGSSQLEQGLLSLTFHPDYQENGYFFVNYTDLQGNTHLARFQVSAGDPDQADPASEVTILTVDQPYPNHNGGQLQFGPDGYLYAGLGDGGSANDPLGNGQNPSTLLGTILRLDVDGQELPYAIPATNPFANDENSRGEIWAWGLRNPWRFSFDRLTGDLLIADVGQNLWEEVNFQPASSLGGENYGWNIVEGSHCFQGAACNEDGLVRPVFEYDHTQGCSVTGGYMYRGEQFASLYGNYFVGDFCSGLIWRLFPAEDGSWQAAMVLDTDHVISSFGEDVQGELFLLDHTAGSLYRLEE